MADEDLFTLAADLGRVPTAAYENVLKALEVTARYVKDDWRQGAEVGGKFRGVAASYSSSIDYDIKVEDGGFVAEIGPNHGVRGGRAGFLEDGGGNVRSAPQHAGRDALEANEADFERGLQIAIFDAIAEEIL